MEQIIIAHSDILQDTDWSWIKNKLDRKMIKSGFDAISSIDNGWNILAKFDGKSFMFLNDPDINLMCDTVNDFYGGYHSGSSMSYTMHKLKFISNHGIEELKMNWIQYV